ASRAARRIGGRGRPHRSIAGLTLSGHAAFLRAVEAVVPRADFFGLAPEAVVDADFLPDFDEDLAAFFGADVEAFFDPDLVAALEAVFESACLVSPPPALRLAAAFAGVPVFPGGFEPAAPRAAPGRVVPVALPPLPARLWRRSAMKSTTLVAGCSSSSSASGVVTVPSCARTRASITSCRRARRSST